MRFIYQHEGRRRFTNNPMRGAAHPRWNGGHHVVKGYMKRHVGNDHPMADAAGYAYEHRLIAADAVGRMLERSEHVHHIDCDQTNNAPINLAVVSQSEHRRIHRMIADHGVAPEDALARILEQRT